MFSSAVKSLSSGFASSITANYSIAPTPTAISGPWKIFDAKKKNGGKAASVFLFDRKSIEPPGGSIQSRQGATSLKRAQDEVVDRLRKEAMALARLRHPNILELVEPVEDTRSGGLMFATELVTASLGGVLEEKDGQERAGGIGGRTSKYVVEDAEGGRRRRELELDELEIQKGLLQIGKGLEFLHESAGLLHGNLTPEAIFLNAKSDWKLSSLGFSSPTEGTTTPTLVLSEVLNYDARLPRSVQLNLDYASPDLVMDNNITTSADLFSLGLLIIALFNTPHQTPLETNSSVSTYKRILASPSTTPTQQNNYLCKGAIPKDMLSSVLPRLITRRPAQRFSAREFQQAQYFDSILVSTIRFLDSLPAKTPAEKSAFLRGLPRVLPQFPKSVLEKKVLPALLDETRDPELLSIILQNVFKILALVPNIKRAMSEKVLPALRDIFLPAAKVRGKGQQPERDTSTEGGLMVVLENMSTIASNCLGKQFKDDVLPVVFIALSSPTHSIQDAALHCLPVILGSLDFSTVKNELFPAVAHVFSKTSSLAIKVSGLEALSTLCGGHAIPQGGIAVTASNAILDKHTIQEKVVPLLRVIKTKEPAVMMAALDVFQQAGKVADIEFLATDVLPCLWQFSLGPLLNLEQFRAFVNLIGSLSTRIEQEQTRKLQNLSSSSRPLATARTTSGFVSNNVDDETDFESLVTGRQAGATASNGFGAGWEVDQAALPTNATSRAQQSSGAAPATFSWSTPAKVTQPLRPQAHGRISSAATQPQITSRTVTPDNALGSFTSLSPSKPVAPSLGMQPLQFQPQMRNTTDNTINWSAATSPTSNNWGVPLQPQAHAPAPNAMSSIRPMQTANITSSLSNMRLSSTTIPPPPISNHNSSLAFGTTTRPSNGSAFGHPSSTVPKQGLDKYESLL